MFTAGALLATPASSMLMFEQDAAEGQLHLEAELRSSVSDALFARQYRAQVKDSSQPKADENVGVQVCDALNGCDSKTHTCVADVKNGKDTVDFKLKVFQNDKYISRMALCQQQTWEYGTVKEMLDGLQGRQG